MVFILNISKLICLDNAWTARILDCHFQSSGWNWKTSDNLFCWSLNFGHFLNFRMFSESKIRCVWLLFQNVTWESPNYFTCAIACKKCAFFTDKWPKLCCRTHDTPQKKQFKYIHIFTLSQHAWKICRFFIGLVP